MPATRRARCTVLLPWKILAVAALILILLPAVTWTQTSAQPSQSSSQQSQQPANPSQPQTLPQAGSTPAQQVPGAGATVEDKSQSQTQPQQDKPEGQAPGQGQPQPETHITKEQAKELFRSVDEILHFVSVDTLMPIEHKVKRNLITREEVEKYVDKRMKDDKDTKRLEQAKLVLSKFGLLPRGYDLHAEFLRLMSEQVAAYYDPRSQSVNMLDWLPPDAQKPVLAHELTHALQDQQVSLEKWQAAGDTDDATLPDPQEYVSEEAQAARQCVTEGQAQVVWFDYSLAPMGKNILTAPEFVDAVRASMGASKDSPVFSDAPMFLQESLLMPYTFGLDFVRTVLANRGKEAAFAEMLRDPPIDSRQIMQPETYLMHQKVEPPRIPDFDALVAPTYERFDFGSMGEFDVYLLAKQYGAEDAPNYYRHWRGGYYFAARVKNGPRDQIEMLYYSKWDSPEAARDFAKLYADYTPKRYDGKMALKANCPDALEINGKLLGCAAWSATTDQGPVSIETHDSELLIMEGYDQKTIDKAREVFFYGMTPAAQPKGKKHAKPEAN